MEAFLSRFLTEVDDCLADPSSTKRLPNTKRLRDLYVTQCKIFERLLNATGQESIMSRAEATITIKDGVAEYPLPYGFRQFIEMIERDGDDPNQVIARLRSIGLYDGGTGVQILDGMQGMRVQPVPILDEDQNWTLVYLKGPVKLHYATAGTITATTLVAGTPATDAGEIVLLDDYYNGSKLRIVSATAGAGQIAVISDFVASTKVITIREAWKTTPTGTVVYEIVPDLPEGLDSIYAMDVAIMNTGRRSSLTRRSGLLQDRSDLWAACQNYYQNNVSDRAPSRILPEREDECDPYG